MRCRLRPATVPDASPPPKIKLVYILGSSRSGSTALDTVLGGSTGALSTGELGHLHWALQEGDIPEYATSSIAYCSCGARVEQCPLWSKVVSAWGQQQDLRAVGREADRFETPLTSLPTLLLGRLFRTRAFREHLEFLGWSARSVAEIGGATTVVDSTKVAGRGWCYSLLPSSEFDVRFVHVVRDGPSVVSSMISHYKPHKHDSGPSPWPRLAATAFSTAHWVYMNLASSCLGAFNRRRYLRVRFEDLLDDPDGTLEKLGRFLDLDVREVRGRVRSGEPMPAGHLLCGNRTKGSALRLVRAPAPSEAGLPLGSSLVFLWLAGWLQWAYARPWPRAGPA